MKMTVYRYEMTMHSTARRIVILIPMEGLVMTQKRSSEIIASVFNETEQKK
jgi:hypothetical protein